VPNALALELDTSGIIPGQIWYSKSPILEGDTVKIYTAVWNNTTSSLSAKIEFYDKNVILGSKDIVVPASQLKEVSVSWKVTSGDHSISAKMISGSTTVSGKSESVFTVNNETTTDQKFVPVVIKTANGETATSGDIVKSQIDKAATSLDNIVPESITTPVSKNVGIVDNFRVDTLKNILDSKNETQSKIDELNKTTNVSNKTATTSNKTNQKISTTDTKVGIQDATEKPIAYIKLFFLGILSFIFGSKLVFYFLIVLILFFIIRGIYRKIRNR
jgi:hypothetical protein